MKPKQRKMLAAAAACVVGLVLIWELAPLPDAQARLARLPAAGLGYSSVEVPLTEAEKQIFGKARALKRLYTFRRTQVLATVIDGSRNRHAVHDPTYCFVGDGWRIVRRRKMLIPGGEAMRLDLKKGDTQREAVYWYTDGRTRFVSPLRCWLQAGFRRLTLGWGAEEPVLVILQQTDAGPVPWDSLPEWLPALFDF